jgi:hypothetical protein
MKIAVSFQKHTILTRRHYQYFFVEGDEKIEKNYN